MKKILSPIYIFIIYVLLIALLITFVKVLFDSIGFDYSSFVYLISGLAKAISAFLIMWFLVKRKTVSIKWKTKVPYLHLVLYSLAALILMVLVHFIISGKSDVNVEFDIQTLLNLIIPTIIVAPLAEELIFRNGIQEILAKKFNPFFAILFASVLFGLDHVLPLNFDWLLLVNHSISGLILGYVYHFSKSIIVPIFVHFLFNLFLFLSII